MQSHSYKDKSRAEILFNCKQIKDARLVYLLVSMTVLWFFAQVEMAQLWMGP